MGLIVIEDLTKDLAALPAGKLTPREKRRARAWQIAPWLALGGVSAVPPLALLLAWLLSGFSPLFLVLAITSLPVSIVAAPVVNRVFVFFLRPLGHPILDPFASLRT